MRHAFSLIELVLVVAIIGIVAAIAVPRLSTAGTGTRLDAAAERLRSEFLAAGELARAAGTSHLVQIDPAADAFRVYRGLVPAKGSIVREVVLGAEPYRVRIESTTILDPDGLLVVDGYGMFTAGAKVQLSTDGVVRTINLSGPTKGSAVEELAADDGIGGLLDGVLGVLSGESD